MTPTYLGNIDLLKQPLVAFISSRRYAPKAVMASYDWATAQHEKVVVSTFHSPLERDVMDFLLKKKQPIIYVLSRRMYKRVPSHFQEALDKGRILFISLSSDDVMRVGNENAHKANLYAVSLAQEVVFGSIYSGSHTEKIYLQTLEEQSKQITILND